MRELKYRLGMDIAGVLGFDFLSRFVTKVDYAKRLVSFYDPESFVYTGDGHLVGAHIENSVIEVPAVLDGAYSGNWLFDLGAAVSSLDGSFALVNNIIGRDGVERMAHGAGNEFKVKLVKFGTLEFAGYTIDNPVLSFSIGETAHEFRAERIGILGNDVFQNFVIYIDYAREQIIVEKGDNYNKEFPIDRSGLQLRYDENNNVIVLFVADNTPAAKAGFQVGDVILSINDINVAQFDGMAAIRELLEGKPGTTLEFVIKRDSQEKKIALTLENLF
jgi:membrane-associated protease RseP (regulator of RpoE activity)